MIEQNLAAELAAAKVEISEARHDIRNMRLVVNDNVSEIARIQNELDRFKTRIATGASALAFALAILGWLVEIAITK
ncbi:MAG: hypothetical protein CL793_07570 [Chloroflexi bacterium]|nr:hypothetical protein [Chloroflexota bacterium]|tara:strand:- start:3019 stop:3249 length:231 start_codon:yes stop_codon:yes gene_type:complete